MTRGLYGKKLLGIVALSMLLLTGGCSVSPTIRTDFDRSANFSQYKTYAFYPQLGTDQEYTTLVTEYLKNAVNREMRLRGLRYDEENPDLLVNFYVRTEDKIRVTSSPRPAFYYGYRWGYYGAWGGYRWDTRVWEYTEGTLNIDLIDSEKNQLVWEGVSIGTVTNEDLVNPEPGLSTAVTEILKKYPPYQSVQ